MPRHVAAVLLAIWLAAWPAHAASTCRIPASLPRPHVEGPHEGEAARSLPIGGYTLALIWAPQQCRRAVPGASAMGCTRGVAGRRFLLHGLWPDGEGKDWPQWCRPAPVLPAAVIRTSWCATPSAQLLQHEWAKHGTCIPGTTPARYFAVGRTLYDRLRAPDMAALSRTSLDKGRFAAALAAANPGLPAEAIRVRTDRDGWLEEVWLCLDRRQRYERCRATDRADEPVRIWRGRA